MSFGCIFVPDFPLEAILRAEPELRSQAVAIVEGKPPTETILAVTPEARKLGVLPGMTKLQVEGLPGIRLRPRSGLQESAAHEALLDGAGSFSPRVEDAGPETILLDLSGLGSIFGPLPKIAQAISRRTFDVGLRANVAVAHTLEAARLAARGFVGVTVIPEGKEADVLGSLPVEVLFDDPSQREALLETFRRWGIGKLQELAALPEIALSERLGQRGLELERQARGLGQRLLAPARPLLSFEEALQLDFPLTLLEPLAVVLGRMLEQLCARLKARSLAGEKLCLELTLENVGRSQPHSAIFRRTIALPVPLVDAKVFLKLLELDLKACPPGAPIAMVRLRIEPAPPRPAQNGLFDPSSPEPEKLELTLAKIRGRVGSGRAGSPELLDTYRPQAFRMHSFMPSREPEASCPRTPADLVTALRVFRPPLAVRVHFRAGKPARISSPQKHSVLGEVLWAAGPWRSSGDWWEEDGWMRDEWDIAVGEKNGIVLYRLVHDLIGGEWLLEGIYD